jgi:hypothetical protein
MMSSAGCDAGVLTDEDVSSDRLFGMRRCRGWDIILSVKDKEILLD